MLVIAASLGAHSGPADSGAVSGWARPLPHGRGKRAQGNYRDADIRGPRPAHRRAAGYHRHIAGLRSVSTLSSPLSRPRSGRFRVESDPCCHGSEREMAAVAPLEVQYRPAQTTARDTHDTRRESSSVVRRPEFCVKTRRMLLSSDPFPQCATASGSPSHSVCLICCTAQTHCPSTPALANICRPRANSPAHAPCTSATGLD
jgi:hypothetical protein